jgi:hypothetical protein
MSVRYQESGHADDLPWFADRKRSLFLQRVASDLELAAVTKDRC